MVKPSNKFYSIAFSFHCFCKLLTKHLN